MWMRLIGMLISLMVVAFSLSFCLKGQTKIVKKQAEIKCDSEGYKKGSQAHKDCVKNDSSKNMHQRSIEMQKNANDVQKMMQSRDAEMLKNIKNNAN